MRSEVYCTKQEIRQSRMVAKKPMLIVFDLDYTLWPFCISAHSKPPFIKGRGGYILDSSNSKVSCYPEVPGIIKRLKSEGYTLGFASRTAERNGANQLVEMFGWNNFFTYVEIYPGSKINHFNKLKRRSGIDFQDMIFFDDEYSNIKDLNEHGVLSVLVPNGITMNIIEDGLQKFAENNSSQ